MSDTLQPLLWTQTVGTGPTATYTVLIGYAQATLVGVGGNGTHVSQEVEVDVGPDVPQTVMIIADSLYLIPGADYSWPGKNVTIVARKLAMTSKTEDHASIDVSGAPGKEASPPTPPAPPALPKPPPAGTDESGNGNTGWPGTQTPPPAGAPGAAGNPGSPAGSINLVVYEVDEAVRLKLTADGGAGSPGLNGQDGQPGQAGQDGGDGVDYGIDDSTDGGAGGMGGPGGNGGPAGNGADGGAGGTITILTHAGTGPPGYRLPATVTMSTVGGLLGANGRPGHAGQPGPPGNNGTPDPGTPPAPAGAPAADGAQPTKKPVHGLPGSTSVKTLDPGEFGQHLVADQIVMVINRLRFAYLTTATLGKLAGPAGGTEFAKRLGASIAWLQDVTPTQPTEQPGTSGWAVANTLLSEFAVKVANGLDSYCNTFSMVPSLNPDVSNVKASIETLRETQTWCQGLAALVKDYETNKEKIQAQFSGYQKRISIDKAADAQLRETLKGSAASQIEQAADAVAKAHETLNADFTTELTEIKNALGISISALLGSLGQTLMMANPEAGGMFATGAGFSVLSQFDPSTINAGGEVVNKAYLLNQVKDIEASADSLAAAWTASNGGFLTPNGTSTMLLADQQKFDAFFDRYMPENSGLRTAMDAYMAAVQSQNQAVLDYNKLVAKLLAAEAGAIEAANASALLGSNLGDLDSPGLMQLARLANHAYASQLLGALEEIYLAGRGYECLALQGSSALSELAGLDGLSGLDAEALAASLTSLLSELEAFRTSLATVEPEEVRKLYVSTTSTAMLTQLKKSRQVTLTFDPTLMEPYDVSVGMTGMSEVRVTSARAYLSGLAEGNQVQMNVTSGGTCRVAPSDPTQPALLYNMPPVHRSNIFKTGPRGKLTDHSKPDRSILPNLSMTWGGTADQRVAAPLGGFYTAWTISVPDKSLDLSKIAKILLRFSITYRPFVSSGRP